MGFDLSSAPAAYALIVVTCVVSLYAFYGDRSFINQFCFQVEAVAKRNEYYRLGTAGFLHANLFHLFVNMLTLLFFGPAIENELGSGGFFSLYFTALIGSSLFSLWAKRKSPGYSSIGASGAVSGIVFAYCLFAPFNPLYVLPIPIGIPAILFAVGYVLYSARAMGGGGRIAHEAHIGGAFTGIVATILLQPALIPHFFAFFS